ncbi:hypothetical protein AVEN_155774-1 [Araneus ventricosus]|uniref:CRAL/TRIO N-terminal domain-containing protein n=1 Tax=Araneus ventricosus TaxID=182803 RepID=A0A4Y2THX3_ARAVE|nr:hypothetical protein AVEN_155774-1 [Araneus ventricosus]
MKYNDEEKGSRGRHKCNICGRLSWHVTRRETEINGPYAQFGFESIDKQLWRNKQNDRPISDTEIKAILSQLFKTDHWLPPAELEDIEACLDEEFLLRFLRVESFDSLKAFQRLKNFYDMQEEMLEMFKHCSIDASVVQSMPYFWALPYRPKNNSALLVVTMGKDYCFLEDILQFVMTTHYKI